MSDLEFDIPEEVADPFRPRTKALQAVARWMREKCAKIAADYVAMQDIGDIRDVPGRTMAAMILEAIRDIGSDDSAA